MKRIGIMKLKNILTVLAFVLCASASAAMIFSGNQSPNESSDVISSSTAPTQTPTRTLTLTAAGDCTFGTDVNASYDLGFDAYADEYGTDYFFKNVRDIFNEDDLTILNFEGTLTDGGVREDKQFAFRGDPEYVNILTGSSVEAVNLANNHSSDYGAQSLTDTKQILDNAGVLNCRGEDNVCVTEINGIRVGLVGINYLNDVMKTELESAITQADSMGAEIIILSIHWGVEKATAPNEEQIEAAHRAIDLGADLVIGTHPHVLQGIEKYNGRYILYSLGNFSFGGNNAPADMDTAIWRQTFTISDGILQDDDNYEIIPCRISSSDGYNDYCPTPAEGSEKERIEEKLSSYSAELGIDQLKFR